MLRLTTNEGLAIHHLAKKAKKKIPLYEEKNAERVNIPFFDETMNKTRYLVFSKGTSREWGFIGAADSPASIHL